MKKFKTMSKKMAVKSIVAGTIAKEKVFGIFAQKTGEGFVDSALKILISVIIGALLLGGLYSIFQDTVLPTLQNTIENLFNYKG